MRSNNLPVSAFQVSRTIGTAPSSKRIHLFADLYTTKQQQSSLWHTCRQWTPITVTLIKLLLFPKKPHRSSTLNAIPSFLLHIRPKLLFFLLQSALLLLCGPKASHAHDILQCVLYVSEEVLQVWYPVLRGEIIIIFPLWILSS